MGAMPILQVEGLHTHYSRAGRVTRAVNGVSLSLARGRTLAVVGESGSGKSALALSVMRLLPQPGGAIASGRILLGDKDLAVASADELRALRGDRMSMIFQEPMSALNPVLSIERQVGEVLRAHRGATRAAARDAARDLLALVGIPDPDRVLSSYPHQLSGGMRQRVMIASALACQPDVLIADEPTTALDVTVQAGILALIAELQARLGTAVLFISHDLGVVSTVADHVLVMYAGRVVEEGPVPGIFERPLHPYTQALLAARPDLDRAPDESARRLPELRSSTFELPALHPGCMFANRCAHAIPRCMSEVPQLADAGHRQRVACWVSDRPAPAMRTSASRESGQGTVPAIAPRRVLAVRNLGVNYRIRTGIGLTHAVHTIRAVRDVSFTIDAGEAVALVGESGCGKTSVARAILGLASPAAGSIDLFGKRGEASSVARAERRHVQIVFQDPFASLNPRMRAGDAIAEPLEMYRLVPRGERVARVEALLESVGLRADDRSRYPHQFSGGQRQRLSIARALAAEPSLLVCDEPTSALDVSVQAQILNLLARIQEARRLALLFISHDLAIVRHFTHRIAVMYLGRIVEAGPTEAIFAAPLHPYTQALHASIPRIGRDNRFAGRLQGGVPSVLAAPAGCAFHPRCPIAIERCREETPAMRDIGAGRTVACHRVQAAPQIA